MLNSQGGYILSTTIQIFHASTTQFESIVHPIFPFLYPHIVKTHKLSTRNRNRNPHHYWVTQKLPRIYTENHSTFPIQIRKITVQICGNFWVTQYMPMEEYLFLYTITFKSYLRVLRRGWRGAAPPPAMPGSADPQTGELL